jgi:uracil-DNA glycosylase
VGDLVQVEVVCVLGEAAQLWLTPVSKRAAPSDVQVAVFHASCAPVAGASRTRINRCEQCPLWQTLGRVGTMPRSVCVFVSSRE